MRPLDDTFSPETEYFRNKTTFLSAFPIRNKQKTPLGIVRNGVEHCAIFLCRAS